MVGPSAPSGEHSHRAAPPPDPSVPTPCQEAPAPELPVRFAAGRIDWQQAAYRQRIGTDRVGEEEKCAPPRGFAPEEVPQQLFPWFIMAGVGLAVQRGGHIAVEWLLGKLGREGKRVVL